MSDITGTPNRGTTRYLKARISAITAQKRQLRDQKAALEAQLRLVTRERDAMVGDIGRIANALRREAQKRSWCSEYEAFVLVLNRRTSKPWLIERRDANPGCMCTACVRDRQMVAATAQRMGVDPGEALPAERMR